MYSRRRADQGGAIVELALVASVLATLLTGVIEIGAAWQTTQVVSQAARSASRTLAQAQTNPDADRWALQDIDSILGGEQGSIHRIVIYRSQDSDGSMPSVCAGAGPPGVAGQCSVYSSSDAAAFQQGSWNPTTRSASTYSADYVGVRVEFSHPTLTQIFSTPSLLIADYAVMRIDPNDNDF